MKKIALLTLLQLCATSCSEQRGLPLLSHLNIEAKQSLSELESKKGLATQQSVRLGIPNNEQVTLRDIQVTKVFKQDGRIMLVGKLNIAAKEKEFFTNVIFNYDKGAMSFKKLLKHMIKSPSNKKVTLL